MTDDEMNRRVAEWCGVAALVGLKKQGWWYRANAGGYTDREAEAGRYTLEDAKNHEYVPKGHPNEWVTIVKFKPPDYSNDLNAVHEAEGRLNSRQICTYQSNLHNGVWWSAVHATARQRTEALLRTLGLWIDTPASTSEPATL